MTTTKLKYWLSPDGEIIEIKNEDEDHTNFIWKYLSPTLGREEAFKLSLCSNFETRNKCSKLEELGWRKIGDYGNGLTIAGLDLPNLRLTSRQKEAIVDLFLELGESLPNNF